MGIVEIVFILIIIGVLLYYAQNYLPMAPAIKTLLVIVVILATCYWLLLEFGLLHGGLRFR